MNLPPTPDARALDAVPRASAARADPDRFPDLSLSVVKLLGSGEYARGPRGRTAWKGTSDWRCATTRIRRRRTAAFPTSSRSGCSRPRWPGSRRRTRDDELANARRALHRAEDAAEKVERQVRKSAAALLLSGRASAQQFDAHRHRRVRQGHVGAHPRPAGRRPRDPRRRRAGRRRSRARAARPHRRRARLHRLRARPLRSRRALRRETSSLNSWNLSGAPSRSLQRRMAAMFTRARTAISTADRRLWRSDQW